MSKRIQNILIDHLNDNTHLYQYLTESTSRDRAPTLKIPVAERPAIMEVVSRAVGRPVIDWLPIGDAFLALGRMGFYERSSEVHDDNVARVVAPVRASTPMGVGASVADARTSGVPDMRSCSCSPNGLSTLDAQDPLLRIFADLPTEPETQAQRSERIRKSYDMFEAFAEHAVDGHLRSLIVSGPPGLGKSYTVEMALDAHKAKHNLAMGAPGAEGRHEDGLAHIGTPVNASIVKGSASAIELYVAAYHHSGPNDVLVLDDCDSIFDQADSMNVLKALSDTGTRRSISWLKRSPYLEKNGIPKQFYFKGTIIILSNIPAPSEDDTSAKAIHLRAIYDRAYHVELSDGSIEDVLTRIEHVLHQVRLHGKPIDGESFTFLKENAPKFKTLTIRTLLHIEQLRRLHPEGDWQGLVRRTKF